jgi:hypothetical protein
MRWKPVIDAFAITFSDRWPGAENLLAEPPKTPFALQAPGFWNPTGSLVFRSFEGCRPVRRP